MCVKGTALGDSPVCDLYREAIASIMGPSFCPHRSATASAVWRSTRIWPPLEAARNLQGGGEAEWRITIVACFSYPRQPEVRDLSSSECAASAHTDHTVSSTARRGLLEVTPHCNLPTPYARTVQLG